MTAIITPNWPAPPTVRAFTTTRHSYSGGNLTNPSNQTFKTLFNLPNEPIWLKQTHSNIVLPATDDNRNQEADASFSSTPKQICVVITADCLPLLITNRKGSEVAAIHAGWRGLANGIIGKTLKHLSSREDCLVWLGPAISVKHFEVGRDVYEAFIHASPDHKQAFISKSQDKWYADLYALATMQLNKLGIQAIYGGNFCTYAQADLFYSYRRENKQPGRMASLIWIED